MGCSNTPLQGAHARTAPGGIELFKFNKDDIILEETRTWFLNRMWIQFIDSRHRKVWTVLSDRKGIKAAKFVRVQPGSKLSRDQNASYVGRQQRSMTVRGSAAQIALANNEITQEEFDRLNSVLEDARSQETPDVSYVPVPSQAAEFENASFSAGIQFGLGRDVETVEPKSPMYWYGAGFHAGLHLGSAFASLDANDVYRAGRQQFSGASGEPKAAEQSDSVLEPASQSVAEANSQETPASREVSPYEAGVSHAGEVVIAGSAKQNNFFIRGQQAWHADVTGSDAATAAATEPDDEQTAAASTKPSPAVSNVPVTSTNAYDAGVSAANHEHADGLLFNKRLLTNKFFALGLQAWHGLGSSTQESTAATPEQPVAEHAKVTVTGAYDAGVSAGYNQRHNGLVHRQASQNEFFTLGRVAWLGPSHASPAPTETADDGVKPQETSPATGAATIASAYDAGVTAARDNDLLTEPQPHILLDLGREAWAAAHSEKAPQITSVSVDEATITDSESAYSSGVSAAVDAGLTTPESQESWLANPFYVKGLAQFNHSSNAQTPAVATSADTVESSEQTPYQAGFAAGAIVTGEFAGSAAAEANNAYKLGLAAMGAVPTLETVASEETVATEKTVVAEETVAAEEAVTTEEAVANGETDWYAAGVHHAASVVSPNPVKPDSFALGQKAWGGKAVDEPAVETETETETDTKAVSPTIAVDAPCNDAETEVEAKQNAAYEAGLATNGVTLDGSQTTAPKAYFLGRGTAGFPTSSSTHRAWNASSAYNFGLGVATQSDFTSGAAPRPSAYDQGVAQGKVIREQ